MIRRRHAILLLLVPCAVLWIAGYREGLQSGGMDVSGGPAAAVRWRERNSAPQIRARERLKELIHAPENSRKAMLEAWSVISAFSADEVQAALRHARAHPEGPSATLHAAMLHFRWAQLDPEAALASAVDHPEESTRGSMINSALTAWMARDPEAAFRHAEASSEVTDKEFHRRMMARLLAHGGPASALEKSRHLGEQTRQLTIETLAIAANDSEESRRAFLSAIAETGTPAEQDAAARALVLRWSAFDPAAALDSLAASGAEAAEQSKDRGEIFQRWMRKDPGEALVWSASHPGSLSMNDRVKSYERLAIVSPAKAAEALPMLEKDPGFLETTVRKLQSAHNREGLGPYGSDSQAHERNRAALRTHFSRWSELFPDDARTWQDSLPADLKDNLTRPTDEGS